MELAILRMYCCDKKFLRCIILSILIVAIATYCVAGISPLIFLAFMDLSEIPVNLILVSVGSIILGLIGCIVIFGTFCENKQIKGDLVPVYWVLYSLLNGLSIFLALAEISYIINEYDREKSAVIILPISIVILVTAITITILSFQIHFLYKSPTVPKEDTKPPSYGEIVEKVTDTPPPEYEESFPN